MITLTAHGAAGEVTGSKHILAANGARILVDCGVFQGRREEAYAKNKSFPFPPSSITACVNTHGHLDHCGSYPLLVRQGFRGAILATPATRDVAELVMLDAARIQAHDAEFLQKQQRRNPQPWRKIYPPLYSEDDVQRALSQYIPVAYGGSRPLDGDVTASLHDAGHIVGSASVRLEIRQNDRTVAVGFTGDLGRKNMPIIRDPDPLPPVDHLVCESTYGDRLHDPIETAEEELAAVVRETAAKGGRVIIPAFAVERTQELIYFLHRLHDAHRIPALPVFVDSPMAVSATGIFRAHPECFDRETVEQFSGANDSPFAFDSLHYVTDVNDSKKLNDLRVPCIVISASGMCEAGRILHHLALGVGDPRNTILVVGFMGAHTLGRALADKNSEVRIFGEPHRVQARVKIINAFSAHADYREIGEYILGLDHARLKAVFLVHGEANAQAALQKHLTSIGVSRVEILAAGRSVTLD